jgi:hypothetical protein
MKMQNLWNTRNLEALLQIMHRTLILILLFFSAGLLRVFCQNVDTVAKKKKDCIPKDLGEVLFRKELTN